MTIVAIQSTHSFSTFFDKIGFFRISAKKTEISKKQKFPKLHYLC